MLVSKITFFPADKTPPLGSNNKPQPTILLFNVATFDAAAVGELVPVKFDAGLAFMFETSVMLKPTQAAMSARWRDREYKKCWEGFRVSTHPALQI